MPYERSEEVLAKHSAGRQGNFQRVAIVHEWLIAFGGSERVLEQLIVVFPHADLFAVVDFMDDNFRTAVLQGKRAKTTFIQSLPFAKKRYRSYLPLMPLAVEQLDLSGYDLVVSSSHAVAKGVLTGPDQLHICYCHTPMRYAWDLQHEYLQQAALTRGLKSVFARAMLHYMRMWDTRTASGVDQFIANSGYIKRRIKKIYGRNAKVLYPPVDIKKFDMCLTKEEFYLTASRMVPYKRVDLIVKAFASMPNRRLIVIGDGPQLNMIRRTATPNVTILGFQEHAVLCDHLQKAKAFIFAAEEDFGILPVEAQACGTPVIAFGGGGAAETVIGVDNIDGLEPTGVFFYSQTATALIEAVEKFETVTIDPRACRKWAEHFGIGAFHEALDQLLAEMGVSSKFSRLGHSTPETERKVGDEVPFQEGISS